MTTILDLTSSRAARKQHDQIVAWSMDQFRSAKSARTSTERQWYLNLAFFFGRQWVVPIRDVNLGTTTRLYTPPAPPWRQRPIINRIRKTIRMELSQLTSNKPNASIIPASSEDKDIYAADAGEQLWQSEYINKKLKFVIRRAVWWSLITGTGYIKTYWDWSKNNREGDIVYIHETPFHVFIPDLREEEIENQPFLIHAHLKDQDYIAMHYKTQSSFKGNTSDSEILAENYLNIPSMSTHDKNKKVLVLEVHVKPGCTKLFPDGGFFTIIDNKVVQGQIGMAFGHNKYPFAKIDHIPSGKFYATSNIEDLIPLQKEYNRTRGQIIEAKNRMSKPWILAPKGSIDGSKITSEPGQVIEYQLGLNPPSPFPMQELPSYVPQELERILMDWNDIAGQHEVTQGQVPPGVTAATAISYLQERDESTLSPTFDSLEESIEKTAQMSLWYIREFWTTERTVKVTGVDGSFDVLVFKGSDLGDNIDIRIEAGSSLPVSKAAKQAFIMDLMKFGWIDPKKGLEVMEMGGINKIYERIQVDKRQAQRENLRMMRVTPDMPIQPGVSIIPVNTWDNHHLHIEEHNNCRKSQAFESASEEVKAEFEAHVNMHLMAMADPRYLMTQGQVPLEDNQQPGPEPIPESIGEDSATTYGG